MKISRVFAILIFMTASGLLYLADDCPAQQYYMGGDVNRDGWCNWADYSILDGYFRGFCNDLCLEGADFNGNGNVNGIDLIDLYNFLTGTGAPPTGSCTEVTLTCDLSEEAVIWLKPVSDSDPDQATFSVYIEASTGIGSLNFSFEYEPADISEFTLTNQSNISGMSVIKDAPNGIVAFLVLCESRGDTRDYPMGTGGNRIFDIVIDRQPGAQNSTMRIVEDPIHGPPYFYYGAPGHCAGEDIIFPFVPQCTGDVNASCTYNGLDITYGISYFKGGSPPVSYFFYNVPVQWGY